jgi:hypothetical protein
MVSAWKESGRLKDLKIEELNFQLGQAAAQLEVAKAEAATLQQQLADSTTQVGVLGSGTTCRPTDLALTRTFPCSNICPSTRCQL